jgi:hypothetical protein
MYCRFCGKEMKNCTCPDGQPEWTARPKKKVKKEDEDPKYDYLLTKEDKQ